MSFKLDFDPADLAPGLTIADFESADLSLVIEALESRGGEAWIQTTHGNNFVGAQTYGYNETGSFFGAENPLPAVDLTYRFAGTNYLICITTDIRIPPVSPIGLDVDGSGSVERVDADVPFDFDADGTTETVSEWFAPTEGILFDSRIPGEITGAHLFGDQGGMYADGFEKLALLDVDRSSFVEGIELDGLAIWTDANTNGVVDAGEVSSLADHQVTGLSTSHTNFVSEARLADGSTMVTEDLWLPIAPVVARANPLALVGLGLAALGLVGFAGSASRRRRDGLDQELIELTSEVSPITK